VPTLSDLRAEAIKLRTIRSTWWFLAVTAVVSLSFSGLGVTAVEQGQEPGLTQALTGPAFGQLLLMLFAARSATQEYQTGTVWASYLACPDWRRLIGAKAAVAASVSSAAGAVLAVAGLLVAVAVRPGSGVLPGTPAEWGQLCAVPVVFALTATIGVAAGVLLKSGGRAIALLLGWSVVGELAVAPLGQWLTGIDIAAWLPFTAMNAVMGDSTAARFPGGSALGLLYVTTLACALLAAAAAVQRRREL